MARFTSTWRQFYYIHEIRLTQKESLLEWKYFTGSMSLLTPNTVSRHVKGSYKHTYKNINKDMDRNMPLYLSVRGALIGLSGCRVPATPRASFAPHYLKIMLEVKASEPPHVLKLWLGVSKGMLPVKYIRFKKASFCVSRISWR